MANKEISELPSKTVPVTTDEIEIQETGGGISKKATLGNVFNNLRVTTGTEVTTTSGTTATYSSIDSTVTRIVIMLNGISGSSTGSVAFRLGDSGGIETSGYTGGGTLLNSTNATTSGSGTSFVIGAGLGATSVLYGHVMLTLVDAAAFTWNASWTVYDTGTNSTNIGAGQKALSAALTQIQIYIGSGAFDAGAFNIQTQ